MDKVLITGGAGFIGLKLAKFLSKDFSVSLLDLPDKFNDTHSKFKCYEIDISEKFSIDEQFDYVFHIAAQSGGKGSLDNPQLDCIWNCLGTVNVVEFCRQNKPKKLIYISSMAIYGNELNCTEDTVPNPISYYGVSKLSGEYYTKLITEFEKIPYTIFRLFATYGHGQDMTILNQGIVSIYIALSKQSDTISITGKKNRIRQLVHVDDVCNAFELSLKDDTTDGETYNVLFDEEITPEKIITEISNATKKDLKINEVDGYRGDQTKITGKNSKLCSIGWKPMINLKDGVNKFIKGLEDVRTN